MGVVQDARIVIVRRIASFFVCAMSQDFPFTKSP